MDDLDRCEPDAISSTLDAIRLVMDIKNVVVIIGIDHRIAFRAIEIQYSDLADDVRTSSDIARDYLGKIIQLPIQLPKPALENFIINELFKGVLKTGSSKNDPPIDGSKETNTNVDNLVKSENTDSNRKKHISEKTTSNTPNQSTRKGDNSTKQSEGVKRIDILTEMVETPNEVEYFTELVDLFKFSNPRQLTRLRNCYRLLKGLEQDTGKKTMLMLFLLEYYYSLHQDEREDLKNDDNYPDFSKLCTTESEISKVIEKEFLERATYESYLRKVSYVVLPHSESQDRAKKEENVDAGESDEKSQKEN